MKLHLYCITHKKILAGIRKHPEYILILMCKYINDNNE